MYVNDKLVKAPYYCVTLVTPYDCANYNRGRHDAFIITARSVIADDMTAYAMSAHNLTSKIS